MPTQMFLSGMTITMHKWTCRTSSIIFTTKFAFLMSLKKTSVHNFIAFVTCNFFMSVMFDECMFMLNKILLNDFFTAIFTFLMRFNLILPHWLITFFTNTYFIPFSHVSPNFLFNWRFSFTANPNTFWRPIKYISGSKSKKKNRQ